METINREQPEVNEIDKELNCVRLRWHRTAGDADHYSAKELVLVPVESIHGKVHVVRGDLPINLIHSNVRRGKKVGEL